MNLGREIDKLLNDDIDDVISWGRRVRPPESFEVYDAAARIVSSVTAPPIAKIKALALMQAVIQLHGELKQSDLSGHVDALVSAIETTDHPEVQYSCARVMSSLLADCPNVSDDAFEKGLFLLKCLMRTSTYPHSREFLKSLFSRGTPLRERYIRRTIARRLPVWAFVGRLATPHKRISFEHARKYDIDWVSFGNFVRDEARRRGMEGTVEQLQRLGQELVDRDAQALCRSVLAQAADWQQGLPIVVDGIRHGKVLAALKQLVAPCEVILQRVDVEPALWDRLLLEKLGDPVKIEKAKHAPTEQEVEQLSRDAARAAYVDRMPERSAAL